MSLKLFPEFCYNSTAQLLQINIIPPSKPLLQRNCPNAYVGWSPHLFGINNRILVHSRFSYKNDLKLKLY